MIYKFNSRTYEKCLQFALDRQGKSKRLYKQRGESRLDKVTEDIVVGALGEIAASKYFKERGYKCSDPDFEVYEEKSKSYDADLIVEFFDVHVKSQSTSSFKRYGASYLCQKSDKLYKRPGIRDVLCFARVDLEAKEVKIVGCVKARSLKEHGRWGEAKVPKYRHTKVALYLQDFLTLLYQFPRK